MMLNLPHLQFRSACQTIYTVGSSTTLATTKFRHLTEPKVVR